MNFAWRLSGILGVLAMVFCFTAQAEEMVDNPQYQSWSSYKPGTIVTVDNEMNMGGMNMKTSMTWKLQSISAEKAVVLMTMNMPGGQSHSQTQDIMAKLKKEEIKTDGTMPPDVKGKATPLPDETLTISGKSYRCKVVEFTGESKGQKVSQKMSGKSWSCP